MRARKKIGPWHCKAVQANEAGKMLRARVVDAEGRPVHFGRPVNARLAARAPVLRDALQALLWKAELLYLMVRSEHGGMAEPPELAEARSAMAGLE